MGREPGACTSEPVGARRLSQQSGADVVEGRGKYRARRLDVEPEAAVFVLLGAQVAQHLLLGGSVEVDAGDVTSCNVKRQQKQRAAVVAVPRAVRLLRALELLQRLGQREPACGAGRAGDLGREAQARAAHDLRVLAHTGAAKQQRALPVAPGSARPSWRSGA